MIPQARLQAHGVAAIADYPVACRYNNGTPFEGSWLTDQDGLDIIPGATRTRTGGILCVSVPAWPAAAVQDTVVQIQNADTSWTSYLVKSLKGIEDPLASEYYAHLIQANQ